MLSKHHPGPWNVGQISWNEAGDVTYTLRGIKEARHADMLLIDAAPLLFEALNGLIARHSELVSSGDCGFWDVEDEDAMKAARAAIAVTEGRS